MPHPAQRFRLAPLTLATALALSSLGFAALPAHAQSAEAPVAISLPAQPLGTALNELARQARLQLMVHPDLVAGKQAPAVSGNLTPRQALDRLLAGSGLGASINGTEVVVRPAPAPSSSSPATLAEVMVSAQAVRPGDLPEAYAGGQVARGGRVGVLGNKDFMETPFNVTNYTSQVVEDTQARSLADVVSIADPSVRTYGSQGTFADGFQIRGLAFNSVDVSFNGITGIAPVWRLMPEFLERIEVLKGPNALLNGSAPSGNVGGAINVVPKRATDAPISRVTASYESKSVGQGSVDLGRRFGERKEFGIRFNGTYRSGDHARDSAEERSRQMALGLDYRGERLRLELDVMQQKQVTHGGLWGSPALAPTVTKVPAAPSNTRNWNQPWESSDIDDSVVAARAEYDISEHLSLYGAAGRNKSEQHYVTSNGTILDDAGTLRQAFRTHVTPYEVRAANVGMRGRLKTGAVGHEWNVGYAWLDYESWNRVGTVLPGTLTSNLYDPVVAPYPTAINMPDSTVRSGRRRLSSVAVSDTLGFAEDRVQLTLGLRRQQVQILGFNATTGIQATTYDRFALTPMVGVLWKLSPSTSVYANYIEGLSPGEMAPATAANAGDVFAPYKSKQGEAGVKFDLGRFAVTASVFQIRKPSGGLDPSTRHYSVNAQQRNSGIELNVFGEPWRGLRVLGGLAYIDAKLARTSDGANEGNTAPGQPKTRFNLQVDKDIEAVPGLSFGAGMIYTGPQYLDNANAFRIPAWTRFDVGAQYRTRIQGRGMTFRANVLNVADRSYWQQGLFAGDPRTVRLSASMDF
ncbi:TonB-dependent siderophore receptor [Pseudorhodoferax sp.]|uniref:TonB-dependent siderophore receptor n=1 Tax=Pseudorhodoferax sp. TaxID=1993553 RepID=UPI0039E2C491